MGREKNRVHMMIISIMDIIMIDASFLLANWIRHGSPFQSNIEIDPIAIYLTIMLAYIVAVFLCNSRNSFFHRGPWAELTQVFKGISVMGALLVACMFGVKVSAGFSRLVAFYFYAISICLVFLARVVYKWFWLRVYKKSYQIRRLVVVTTKKRANEVAESLQLERTWDYKLKGFILLDASDEEIEQECCGVQIMGNRDNMFDCLVQRVVDDVFIYIPYNSGINVQEVVENYESMGITVNLNVQVFDMKLRHEREELRSFGKYYTICFNPDKVGVKMRFVKRVMDIAGAIVGLLITAVVLIFLAPILKMDSPGPLIFAQTRVGLNGRRFKFYKFRSMYVDAEERKKELMKSNEIKGLMFKMTDDPRITKVGKFIRRTSIDELPQFWNVLRGDMSLIGTRPPTEDEFEQYKSRYKRRLSIRPGITGMWQVSGRSDITDFEEVLRLDLEYIDNWSLSLDLKILIKTVIMMFKPRGAK